MTPLHLGPGLMSVLPLFRPAGVICVRGGVGDRGEPVERTAEDDTGDHQPAAAHRVRPAPAVPGRHGEHEAPKVLTGYEHGVNTINLVPQG